MFSFKNFVILLASVGCSSAFAPHAFAPTKGAGNSIVHSSSVAPLNMGYVPDGLSAAEYQKIKQQEMNQLKGKDLARLGPRGFKSRSMEAWQRAYERGQATHSIAPFGYKEALKKGEIKKQDVPYMVRGGSWDNSDVKGARRLPWLKQDKEYQNGGYKKEQSASILGSGPGFDWTGNRPRNENLKRVIPGLS